MSLFSVGRIPKWVAAASYRPASYAPGDGREGQMMAIAYHVELTVRQDEQDGLDRFVVGVEADDIQAAIDEATAMARAEGLQVVDAVAKS